MAVQPLKVFVAVHGIGNQVCYETAQTVATRVASYCKTANGLPLGRFYGSSTSYSHAPEPAPRVMRPPEDPVELAGFGFAEVYWADVARTVAETGYVLEETKKWARSIGARLAHCVREKGDPLPARERLRIATILDQIIETVAILERLSYLPTRLTTYEFNLRKLLVDFVDDVQIVADFKACRQRILTEFDRLMVKAAHLGPDDASTELYIVAHSEGSVVAFLALLNALADPDCHPWIHRVRGVMTIGSPIETHHLLWPELWRQCGKDHGGFTPHSDAPRGIPWRNYYDHGDPIAFQLDATGKWLQDQGFGPHLHLEQTGFSRYLLPGFAHTDYWQDDGVFGHFLQTVAKVPPPRTAGACSFERPPRSRASAVALSYAAPYLLVFLVLAAAVYSLYRPVSGILHPASPQDPGGLEALTIGRDVFGIACLLSGVTAAARIPRLSRGWLLWAGGAVLVVSMFLFSGATCASTRRAMGWGIVEVSLPMPTWLPDLPAVRCGGDEQKAMFKAAGEHRDFLAETRRATWGVTSVAALVALIAGICARWLPRKGVLVLPAVGALMATALVAGLLWTQPQIFVWPLVLGLVLFFYLWWLGAQLLDLVFVWHHYIRHSAATLQTSKWNDEGYKATPLERIVDSREPVPVLVPPLRDRRSER